MAARSACILVAGGDRAAPAVGVEPEEGDGCGAAGASGGGRTMAWANPKVIPAHLEFRELEAELIRNHGNVTAAAKTLGVPSADLRRLVWSTKLADTVYEAVEETLDEAVGVLRDALRGADLTHKLQAAKTMLTQTTAGRRRGFGSGSAIADEPDEAQPVTIKWLEH